MFGTVDMAGSVLQVLEGSVEADFRRFVREANVTKWIIAADFALSDKERHNDVFAFTVFPLDSHFDDTVSEIRNIEPKDIKDVRSVKEPMLEYLRSPKRFHFCFMPAKWQKRFLTLEQVRQSISSTIQLIEDAGPDTHQELLAGLLNLRREAQAGGFNFHLLKKIEYTAMFAALISFLLIKHGRPQLISLFPDRDKITEAYGAFANPLWSANIAGLCDQRGYNYQLTGLSVASQGESALPNGGTWFDELIHIPDYLAGAVSKWDIVNNRVVISPEKHLQIVEEVLADNPNILMVKMVETVFGTLASRVIGLRPGATEVARPFDPTALRWWIPAFPMKLTEHELRRPRKLLLDNTCRTPVDVLWLRRFGPPN